MKTNDLIDALAAGLEPAPPARPNPLLLAAAAAAAVCAVSVLLGVRPDLATALQAAAPWLKGLYTISVASAAILLATRLGRPGVDARPALAVLLAVIGTAVLWAVVEVIVTSPGERLSHWLGRTWMICGRNILIVSAVVAPLVFLSARRLAPTRPSLAGAALGVATGGIAATAYGLLHCPESTAAFIATWYTLGMAAAGVVGAAAGRIALRW
jgi:hypothetical protein